MTEPSRRQVPLPPYSRHCNRAKQELLTQHVLKKQDVQGDPFWNPIPSGCPAMRCPRAEPDKSSASLKLAKSDQIARVSLVTLFKKPVRRASIRLKRGEPSGIAG